MEQCERISPRPSGSRRPESADRRADRRPRPRSASPWPGASSALLRVRTGITAGLRDEDPTVRGVAVQQAAEMGLASTAPALLRAVRAETDPAVLAAVVRAVAARQWEPASTGGIVELRLWARAYAEKHPELRRDERRTRRCSPASPAPCRRPRSTRRGPTSSAPGRTRCPTCRTAAEEPAPRLRRRTSTG